MRMAVCKMTSFLKRLGRTKDPNDIKRLLKSSKKDDIQALTDFTLGVMKKEFPASARAQKFITTNRRALKHILDPKYSYKSKRRYIIQRGGSIFSALAGLFSRAGARIS